MLRKSNQLKTSVQINSCTQMFMAALVVAAKTWEQPKISINRWTNYGPPIHTMEYDSAIKRKETLTCVTVWMNL